MNWEVTTKGGGSEVVIVIASRAPQPDLERDVASFRRAAEAAPQPAYAQLSAHTTSVLRGIGGLMEAPEDGGSKTSMRLSDALRALPSKPEVARELWTWQIQLRNSTSN